MPADPDCDGSFRVGVVRNGDETRIVLAGEIDMAARGALDDAMSVALGNSPKE